MAQIGKEPNNRLDNAADWNRNQSPMQSRMGPEVSGGRGAQPGSTTPGMFQKFSGVFNGVKTKHLALFSWNLHTMLAAGIPLTRSLDSAANQTSHPLLQTTIIDIIDKINTGLSFSEALAMHPAVFPRLFVNMIEVGEIGGVLDESLKEVAQYYDAFVERKSRILSAISYPIVLLTGCLGVVIFILVYLVPRLFKLFENIGSEMPPTTLALLKMSAFIQGHYFLLLSIIVGVTTLASFYLKTEPGRLFRDKAILQLPIAGTIILKIILSRFSHTMSIMLRTGVSLVNALNIAIELAGNRVVAAMIESILEAVNQGSQINTEMRKHRLVPDMVVHMIAVGEETGTLEQMLAKVSSYYDREVNRTINGLTKLVEPLMLVIMAVVVGFIAISVLDPITDLMTNMGR
jgi:type IV pilus assembly protein PilC